MNLNEAFRYANFLTGMIECVYRLLLDHDFTRAVTVVHKRSEVAPGFIDTIENPVRDTEADFMSPDEAIDLVLGLIAEKEELMRAIENAKTRFMDGEIGMNKVRRMVATMLINLGSEKQSIIANGFDECYATNADGNQTRFCYKTVKNSEALYDRAAAKQKGQELMAKIDEVSREIDDMKVNRSVYFTPLFVVTDTLEDIYIKFKNKPVQES